MASPSKQPQQLHVIRLDGQALAPVDKPTKAEAEAKESKATPSRPVKEKVDEKVRQHLHALQGRNRLLREQRSAEEQRAREAEAAARGPLSARQHKTPPRTLREQDVSPAKEAGAPGAAKPAEPPDGQPLRWDERTVQLLGDDGAVYAIRPSGERPGENELQATATLRDSGALPHVELNRVVVLPSAGDGQGSEVPADVDEALRATLTATPEQLQDLCRTLRLQSEPAPNATDALELSTTCEAAPAAPLTLLPSGDGAAVAAPAGGEELAARIASLPEEWRGALLRLLEEAEDAVSPTRKSPGRGAG